MKKSILFLLALGVSIGVHAQGDPELGKALSTSCGACHGPDGVSSDPLTPNLAGQKSQYLVKQLKSFREDERHDQMMTSMTTPLDDQQIEDLAAYFSSLSAACK